MVFKKINYNSGEPIIEIKIKDGDGKFLENWVIHMSDLTKFVNIMGKKYGLNFRNENKELGWTRY